MLTSAIEDEDEDEDDDETRSSSKREYPYRVLKSRSFSYDNAMKMLRRTQIETVGSSGDSASSTAANPYALESAVNTLDVEMIRACGALLSFIAEAHNADQLRRNVLQVTINRLVQYNLKSYMYIDDLCLRALDIFCPNAAPVSSANGRKGKEGFSLFMILNRTCTSTGQRLLRNWMRKPVLEADVVLERQRAVAYMKQQRVLNYYPIFASHLRKTSDLCRIVLRIKKAESTVTDWSNLKRTIDEVQKMSNLIAVMREQMPSTATTRDDDGDQGIAPDDLIFELMERAVTDDVLRVHRDIVDHVDFERSNQSGRMCIRDDVDESLNVLRRFIANLDVFLARLTNDDAQEFAVTQPMMRNIPWEYQYRPRIGFTVAVIRAESAVDDATFDAASAVATETARSLSRDSRRRDRVDTSDEQQQDDRRRNEGAQQISPPGLPSAFQFLFCVNGVFHYRSRRTTELNERYGDVVSKEIDLEQSIMIDIEERVLGYERAIVDLGVTLSEFDVLFSYAISAHELNLVRPELTDRDCLVVKRGRHPLQEQTVDEFIPNDIMLKSSNPTLSVVTGPNYSGKSIYLKTVGLIAYMTYIGQFVPAERAMIGPIDRIFCRVKTYESVSVGKSTFQIDCSQMSTILHCATRQSLVLMDEFGKGTDVVDGMSLFTAVLCSLMDREDRCPKIVAVTHFNEALDTKEMRSKIEQTRAIHLHMATMKETDRMIPLFEIRHVKSIEDFKSASSDYGLWCARMAGVDDSILNRARIVFDSFENGKPIESWEDDDDDNDDNEIERAARQKSRQLRARQMEALSRFVAVKSWLDCDESVVRDMIRCI